MKSKMLLWNIKSAKNEYSRTGITISTVGAGEWINIFDLENLVKDYPNDTQLGQILRSFVHNAKNNNYKN